ncbi:SirB1 family protein [Brevundimonas lenta]|uniref:Regulator of sirC expression with transglutaminase-like and TPR domain n=1 Tax=Brevundimonas lenta TaxID=424796 RepID=A0A7W6JAK5_9CAUL|nr:transglutaminase family protein [Brevundimonas lenta]MBB4081591.1 regulator of sirC expression with transglutaminase-like and TPR domain [Brevundimonas lenta]
MTRDEAEFGLTEAGQADDDAFPLLEAAIACAIHDYPFRDPEPVRVLAAHAAERLAERITGETPDDALAETMSGDLRLNGDLINYDHPGNTDVIDVAERRRGLSAALSIFYLDAARRAGIKAQGVDFPGHFLLRVETPDGPVALDPFSQGRLVLPSELTRRALRAGLTPHVADRLDVLMAPVSDREALIRLQNVLFSRAIRMGDYEGAERSAVRRALLDPEDHRPWLDVAAAREKQGALAGALEALSRARTLDDPTEARRRISVDRVRLQLN